MQDIWFQDTERIEVRNMHVERCIHHSSWAEKTFIGSNGGWS
jgi:hypothetical protein